METPVTRDAVAAIDKRNAVYNYTVLQFAGITETATLLGKATYSLVRMGVITTADVELQRQLQQGPAGLSLDYRFVVIANVDGTDFNTLQENTSTYSDFAEYAYFASRKPRLPFA